MIGLLVVEDVSLVRAVERPKDFLVRALAHDMSNPITSIGVGLELALQSEQPSELKAIHEQTLGALGRLQAMVQNLFDITRLHTEHVPLNLAEARIDEMLDQIASSHRPLADKRNVSLEVEHGAQFVSAEIDVELVRRALENLVDNAIRFTDAGGEIRLSTEQSDGRATIRVRDNGTGIAQELRGRIFQPYVTGGAGFDEGRPHVGLGLAFVELVAREHGGTVSADCPDAGGTLFTLQLPSKQPG